MIKDLKNGWSHQDKTFCARSKCRARELKNFYQVHTLKRVDVHSGEGSSSWIAGITLDNRGYVYISDQFNSEIYKYDPDLCFVWQKSAVLTTPLEIVHFNHHLYVSDVGNGTIAIFSLDGKLVGYIGVDKAKLDLNGLFYMATDKRRRLYIFVKESSMLYVLNAENTLVQSTYCDIGNGAFVNRIYCEADRLEGRLFVGSREGDIYHISASGCAAKYFTAGEVVSIGAMVDFVRIGTCWFLVDHSANSLIKVDENGRYFIWKNSVGWLLNAVSANGRLYVTTGSYGSSGGVKMVEV